MVFFFLYLPFFALVSCAGRGQGYAVRDQESPPFISAAAATGSPIIAPGGTYPPQVYQLPPIAYVQSTGGMATQPMVQQVGQTFYCTEKYLKNPSRVCALSNICHIA